MRRRLLARYAVRNFRRGGVPAVDLVTDGLQLLYGDCLARMAALPAGSVDLILTDPPYGTTACRWDSVIPLGPMWQAINRLSKPTTPAVFTAAQPFTTALIASNLDGFKYCWVWDKKQVTGFLNAKKQPLRRTEDIVVFYTAQPAYFPQMGVGKKYRVARNHAAAVYGSQTANASDNDGTRYPTNVLELGARRERGAHPTQKPVELMAYLIRTYTSPGDVVLDFTMGSGTTGIAAVQEGRRFIGIERDPGYYALACTRIMQARASC